MHNDYEKARLRVERKKAFYLQLVSYLFILIIGGIVFANPVSPLLMVIKFWFYWIMVACGVSMMLRYFRIFGLPEIVEDMLSIFSNWEEKSIRREMDKLETERERTKNKAEAEEQLSLKELQRIQPDAIDDSELV